MKHSQEVRIVITANTIENAIIQNNIANNEIKRNLTELCNKLKGKEIVEFYTDGAMEINKATGNKMGIGWIAKLENEIVREISFSCSLEKQLSSTRAELGAIWTALLATLSNSQVHIHTDSKAAIEVIEKHREDNKLRNWFKVKNRSLLRQILSCCIAKNLDLKLHKVKGHSGNLGNDLADYLAKSGISTNNVLNIPESTFKDMMFIPKWKD